MAAMFVGGAALAQTTVDRDSGKLREGQTRVWSITTDSSIILDVVVTMVKDADPDILVTTGSGNDKTVVADSRSSTTGIEKASVGLQGATTYEIAVTNDSGPTSRFVAVFNTLSAPGVGRGAARIRVLGEFDAAQPVTDPELAALQRLVQQRPRR